MNYLDRVVITEKYDRHWRFDGQKHIKYWRKKPLETTGVIIGFRTLTNGENHSDYCGETYYCAKEHFKVALVVFNQFKNPVYVPLNSIKVMK